MVHSLTEDHRITKTKILRINCWSSKQMIALKCSLPPVFEKFVFPQQKGEGGGLYENTFATFWPITYFSANQISQFKNKPIKLFDKSLINCDSLHTRLFYGNCLSQKINWKKMIDCPKYLSVKAIHQSWTILALGTHWVFGTLCIAIWGHKPKQYPRLWAGILISLK